MKIDYNKGQHYSEFLTVDTDYNKTTTRVTWVKKTGYGYLFHMFNHYITLYYGKLVINADGTAKATIRVNCNYSAPYQYTLYFDCEGYEIKTEDNSTRKELLIYKQLRANN
jgi:uncharacterized lipoprotein NlpE involved in copper resistance